MTRQQPAAGARLARVAADLRVLVPSAGTVVTLGTMFAAGATALAGRDLWPRNTGHAAVLYGVAAWLVYLTVRMVGMERPDRVGAVLRYLATRAGHHDPVAAYKVAEITGARYPVVYALLRKLDREQCLVRSRAVTDTVVGPGRRNVIHVYEVPAEAAATLRGLADNRPLRALTLGERYR